MDRPAPFDPATLRRNAAGGDPRAQCELAHYMLVAGQLHEASRLLASAAERRFPLAFKMQALLATIALGRPHNLGEALALLQQAAAAGDTSAKGQLAVLTGAGAPPHAWWLQPAPTQQHFDAPRIFTVADFMPKPVCAWLIRRAKKRLGPAMVRDFVNGGYIADPARNNADANFGALEPDLVMQLACLKMGATLRIPIANHEATNILHYARGQQYRPHYDFVSPKEATAFADELNTIGQRIATMLIYLNEDYEGGETAFPRLNWAYKGKTGDALIFWNVKADGALEPDSVHAGTPITKGEKWIVSKWVRERPVPFD